MGDWWNVGRILALFKAGARSTFQKLSIIEIMQCDPMSIRWPILPRITHTMVLNNV